MTQAPVELREPLERRILNGLAAAAGLVFWWVMLAEWIGDLPGPQDLVEDWRERRRERRRYHAAMLETLADIDELPELDEHEVDGLG